MKQRETEKKMRIRKITCKAVNRGKYKSGSSYLRSVAPSTLGIIWRPSNAAIKYEYKTKVTTCWMER